MAQTFDTAQLTTYEPQRLNVAPGSVVLVRDEEWIVTSAVETSQGTLVRVQGISELVRDTHAAFYSGLDDIEVLNPAEAKIVWDDSRRFRLSRLFLETTLRTTPAPILLDQLTVSTRSMATPLKYQQLAVAKALSNENLRPRILLADAVGLGKTFEIGMILAELVARGRGEKILIVTPRHVLEQFQQEMWVHFALPFVRLDSAGIQKIRQRIPATRNPFSYYKRAIISIDTLKTPQYRAYLERMRWDAVVIDESHNLTNVKTQNNRLANLLAPRTEALILASATPHNGKYESFAELVRLLDPTAVSPSGEIDEKRLEGLLVRRHRYSPEVSREVAADWAERQEPRNLLIEATPAENAVADELAATWLYPESGKVPTTSGNALFGWTLAKAFLSSPVALQETIDGRITRTASDKSPEADDERAALRQLGELNAQALAAPNAKLTKLVQELKDIGIKRGSTTRAVVFAERRETLLYLQEQLKSSLKLGKGAVRMLHGGLTDQAQQEIVEEFKRGSSDLRVLVAGDMASEGVNLHAQCHHLFHYDIPWSLIRIEQRNGRIDRYGQRNSPVITSLILTPDQEHFSGDVRILTSLVDKEHTAHKVLADVASLMGKGSPVAEEKAIMEALRAGRDIDDIISDVEETTDPGGWSGLETMQTDAGTYARDDIPEIQIEKHTTLYDSAVDYLEDALVQSFENPHQRLNWRNYADTSAIAEFDVTDDIRDLRRRLEFLPQDYVQERRVFEHLRLATTVEQGRVQLEHARDRDGITWPAAHYLGPLHPVLNWASDRALAKLSRNQVLALYGNVDEPTFLILGTISNGRGQLLSRIYLTASDAGHRLEPRAGDLNAWFDRVGLKEGLNNPGPESKYRDYSADLAASITAARSFMEGQVLPVMETMTNDMIADWKQRVTDWESEADTLTSRAELRITKEEVRKRRHRVREESALAEDFSAAQTLVRPLVLILPTSHA